jgi:hypothetical protein
VVRPTIAPFRAFTDKLESRGPPRGGRYDRYDDRRPPYGGRRDDGGYRAGGGRYDSYSDRTRDRRDYRDDYGGRGIDRYAGGRDDRVDRRGEDRRGGYQDREDRRGGYGGGYDSAPPRDTREPYSSGGPGRSFDNVPERFGER